MVYESVCVAVWSFALLSLWTSVLRHSHVVLCVNKWTNIFSWIMLWNCCHWQYQSKGWCCLKAERFSFKKENMTSSKEEGAQPWSLEVNVKKINKNATNPRPHSSPGVILQQRLWSMLANPAWRSCCEAFEKRYVRTTDEKLDFQHKQQKRSTSYFYEDELADGNSTGVCGWGFGTDVHARGGSSVCVRVCVSVCEHAFVCTCIPQ